MKRHFGTALARKRRDGTADGQPPQARISTELYVLALCGLVSMPYFPGCERSPDNASKPVPAVSNSSDEPPAISEPVYVDSRQRISLQEYCAKQVDILQNNPNGFANFVQTYTPFPPDAKITATFNSAVHGHAITIDIPCSTFIVFANPKLSQWTLADIGLQQTGGLVSSIHAGLGADYSKNDPEDIRRLARLAVHDISINSQYLSPLIDHLKNAHGVVLLNADGTDSAEFKAVKQQAILQLTP